MRVTSANPTQMLRAPAARNMDVTFGPSVDSYRQEFLGQTPNGITMDNRILRNGTVEKSEIA
jgi:hypothetical protein